MDNKVMFKLSYGLFVLTARQNGRDNGCIINTAQQAASSPNTLSISVSKQNLTHDMILETGLFNVSVLDNTVPFEVFRHFGFQSGRDAEKFQAAPARGGNGLVYLPAFTNAYMGCKVRGTVDLGSHTLFLAELTEGEVLSSNPSVTYAEYHARIKPQPKQEEAPKKGWRCTVCGYVYEGEELPPDFICPLCKHGAEDFERI